MFVTSRTQAPVPSVRLICHFFSSSSLFSPFSPSRACSFLTLVAGRSQAGPAVVAGAYLAGPTVLDGAYHESPTVSDGAYFLGLLFLCFLCFFGYFDFFSFSPSMSSARLCFLVACSMLWCGFSLI